MKTKNYLKKTSQHLFQITNTNTDGITYMKVFVENDQFRVLKFDKDLEVTSDRLYKISDFDKTSPKGKNYVDTYLKDYVLFYKGYEPNYYTIKTIKHFKKFRVKLSEYLSQVEKVAA